MPCSVVAVLLLFFASFSQDRLDGLARSGSIDESAPVKASSEIIIDAPPARVWQLLTGVKDWPQWQKNISASALGGPLEPGTLFTWKIGGTEIHSKIALVRPVEQFVWTGVVFKARAIHVWSLQPLPNGRTLVKTSESMNGFMLSMFYSSKQLEVSHHDWLTSLKLAAERPLP